jgi:hypothetical protein
MMVDGRARDLRRIHDPRLRPAAGAGTKSAMPIAARFLDVFNVFLFVRQLVGGERE